MPHIYQTMTKTTLNDVIEDVYEEPDCVILIPTDNALECMKTNILDGNEKIIRISNDAYGNEPVQIDILLKNNNLITRTVPYMYGSASDPFIRYVEDELHIKLGHKT